MNTSQIVASIIALCVVVGAIILGAIIFKERRKTGLSFGESFGMASFVTLFALFSAFLMMGFPLLRLFFSH